MLFATQRSSISTSTAQTRRSSEASLGKTLTLRVLRLSSCCTAPEIGRFLGHADGGHTARRHYIGASAHEPALKLIKGVRG